MADAAPLPPTNGDMSGAVGAWNWDIASRLLVADARFASLYGLDPAAAAAGLPASAFFEPVLEQDRLRLRIAVAGALRGAEVFARDYRVLLDGEVRWVSARGRTYFDETDTPTRFAGRLTDVTEQKRLEERLRIAQTAGGVGSFEYLSGYGTADVSDEFCRLLGLHTAKSLPVRTINSVVHPDDPPIIQGRDGSGALGTAFHEFRIHRADTGEERWLASRGEYRPADRGGVSFIGVIYDITASKRSEAALRLLTETLEERVEARTQERDRIWNLSGDLLNIIEPDGTQRAVNPAWKRVLGHDEAELVGRSMECLIHADDLPLARTRLEALARGEPVAAFDTRLRAKDGSHRWINWTGMSDGETIYGIGRDVTQRKLLEEQLRHSQKMEAVGQLTGGLAHDFNNMLTGVMGGIDMARMLLAQGRLEDVDRLLEASMQSGQRAAALTHRLLAFSRRQALDNQPLDVGTLIGSMQDLLRRTLGEQVELHIDTPFELWTTLADESQLESAILNLAINARDAMPDGGRLTIAARNASLSEADLAGSDQAQPGEFVEILVTDTGLGMPPEVLAKAFDPFYTTKPVGQGTGLGLSMIYGFVQQSRGHVAIESQEGRGTKIRLYLPRHDGGSEGEATPEMPTAITGSGEIVLVVEDDPAVLRLMLDALRELGYRTIETASGKEAVPILQSRRHLDLLISDVGLPGLNGRQIAEIARQIRPDMPVLLMTAYTRDAGDEAGFLAPGIEVMQKPFSIDQLGRRVTRILRSPHGNSSAGVG
ncbi:PAS domain-containing protein [Roseomonas hellenica]|uniref:histidine kinase n=1 Tax=Plastoroseomonas hellenica TaxID=2687306 RepID=A0ABS5EVW7_9PROT|nr:PAS domain-containing sensor histidine kinase [Plastoroseomonas hellenica]MBR0664439.1 PAS domain-containing protein [Plastoroseomonas hellenica]